MRTPMTYTAHFRAIALLGLPLIGGHLAQMAIAMTDTVMMGWYGVQALAAVTLASSYFFIVFMLGSGVALAVMPMVAAAAGAGDQTSTRRATRMGLWLSLGYGVLAMPLMWWSQPILLLLGQSEAVSEMAAQYLRVAGWGIFPALLVMVLKSYLAALERTQIVLWITLLAALANGLANYALIFGNWGAPELGITGAAIASVASQSVSLLVVIVYAVMVLPQHRLFARFWRADWEMLARVLRLGLPIGLTQLSESSMFTASALMMGWLGTAPLAAHGIVLTMAGATFMVHLGLGNVATIRAGNAYGRGDRAGMARGGYVVTAMSLAMSLATILLFLTQPELLISLFLTPGDPDYPRIIAIGTGLLAAAALFQLVDGAQVVALSLLRGMQDTRVPMVIAGLSYWGVGIPTSYLLGFVFGLGGVGVWLGLAVGLGVAGLLLMIRFWGTAIKRVGS